METITSHKTNYLNNDLEIKVLDEPGNGNACHKYQIRPQELSTFDATAEPSRASRLMQACCDIKFQNGPIQENGINGISNEALLAIVEHRLTGFQSGDFSCRENAIALTKIQEAMLWLNKRTQDRLKRGVEGTSSK